MRGFGDWAGIEMDNSISVGMTVDLLNGRWPSAPGTAWRGHPHFQSADATIFGAIKFRAKYVGKDNFWENPILNFNPDFKGAGEEAAQRQRQFMIAGKAQFYSLVGTEVRHHHARHPD